MPDLYQYNILPVTSVDDQGPWVDADEFGIVPLFDAPDGAKVGDTFNAYLYPDEDEDIFATMNPNHAPIGTCAYLEVVSVIESGAFLDWGLPKDLYMPRAEQAYPVYSGDFCVVYIHHDNYGRPIASTKYHHYFDEMAGDFRPGDKVELMIADESDMGFKAIINNTHLGLIHHGELSQPLDLGAKMPGFIKKIRDDGKINLNVHILTHDDRDQLEMEILKKLDAAGGKLDLSDNSAPEDIFKTFGVSKKNFKRAIGNLYKQREIIISHNFIKRA